MGVSHFIVSLCILGSTSALLELPDPRIVIVGPTGSGKSSVANALLGCDPRQPNCTFPVCGGLDSCTKETTIGTGPWLGTGKNFTVVDTPGFGDSAGEDNELIDEMMEVLDGSLGYSNTILLLFDGQTARFSSGLHNMLRQMSSLFGEAWWDYMIIGVSKWKYSQEAIDGRQDDCDYYGDPSENCKNEAWFIREINGQLQEKFHLNKNFTFAFIDSFSQSGPALNDEVQQEHYQAETKILWDSATTKNSTFDFMTIDDVLEENAALKEEIKRLHDIFETNITTLFSLVHENEEKINTNVETIDSSKEMINTNLETININKEMINTNVETININKEMINTNVETIDSNKEKININEVVINTNVETIDSNKEKININEVAINTNVETIGSNKEKINTNEVAINTNVETIGSNKEKINTNEVAINTNVETIGSNKEKINTNEVAINTNVETIGSNKDKITINVEAIDAIANEMDDLRTAPLGTIIAWVNKPTPNGQAVDIPEGWQRCDGTAIPHPSIWAGELTPDLNHAKRFLRGGDDTDMLTMEEDQMQDHVHYFTDPGHHHGYDDKYTGCASVNGYKGPTSLDYKSYRWDCPHASTSSSSHTGITVGGVTSSYRRGTETRPKNMNVIYIMRVW